MKRKFYAERRKMVLRTAEKTDAENYAYQSFPSNSQTKERNRQCRSLEKQIESIKDELSVITILKKENNKFIGFLFTKRVNEEEIQILDVVVPMQSNRQIYVVDSLKQFVKAIDEQQMCKVISFKDDYGDYPCKKYIEEFLMNYSTRRIIL